DVRDDDGQQRRDGAPLQRPESQWLGPRWPGDKPLIFKPFRETRIPPHPDIHNRMNVLVRSNPPQYAPAPSLPEIYAQHADFVFRNLRRLGLHESLIDDAVQDV